MNDHFKFESMNWENEYAWNGVWQHV